jgi:hypothetical protein
MQKEWATRAAAGITMSPAAAAVVISAGGSTTIVTVTRMAKVSSIGL